MAWKSLNMLPNTLSKRTSLMFHQVIKTHIENCNFCFGKTSQYCSFLSRSSVSVFLDFPSANQQLSDQISKKSIGFFVLTKVDQNRMKQLKGYVFFV